MSARDQQIVDALTIAFPLTQRLAVTSKQQIQDASDAWPPWSVPSPSSRPHRPHRHGLCRNLEIAIRRTGQSLSEIAYLSGIAEGRLHAILAGSRASNKEREAAELRRRLERDERPTKWRQGPVSHIDHPWMAALDAQFAALRLGERLINSEEAHLAQHRNCTRMLMIPYVEPSVQTGHLRSRARYGWRQTPSQHLSGCRLIFCPRRVAGGGLIKDYQR